MYWKHETIQSIEKLYNSKGLNDWGDAINSGEIDSFSENLEFLLDKLSSILVSEFELDRSGYSDEKIKRILEMAAMGGKIL